MPNLGIHMSESDLTSPEPEFVTNVYETFVDLLAGVSKEELNQPQFVGLGELEYPELHEDSIPRLALYRATYVFFISGFNVDAKTDDSNKITVRIYWKAVDVQISKWHIF